MFCQQCGRPNPDEAAHCIQCGAYIVGIEPQHAISQQNPYGAPMHVSPPPPGMQKPSNHLAFSIISTVLNLMCCTILPLGIAGIVFASQVDPKWLAGDYQGAIDSSRKAKIFSWIGLALGLLLPIFYLGVFIVALLDGSARNFR